MLDLGRRGLDQPLELLHRRRGGEDFAYANWARSEPDSDASALASLEPGVGRGTDETFLHVYSDGAWNDLSATSQPRGYVLEFDPGRRRRCRERG